MMSLRVGDKVPDLSLSSSSGSVVRLKDFEGRKSLVLFFYPKDNTPGCTKESCAFRDRHDVFKEAGAEVIGISSDSTESHKGFASKHQLPFLLLSDPGGRARKLFGVPSTLGLLPGRVTYIIDKNGRIRHIFSSQFQPTKHVEEALEVLKKLTR